MEIRNTPSIGRRSNCNVIDWHFTFNTSIFMALCERFWLILILSSFDRDYFVMNEIMPNCECNNSLEYLSLL
jgi:hypothetical protein